MLATNFLALAALFFNENIKSINSEEQHTTHLPTWAQRILLVIGFFFGLWLIIYIALRLPPVQDFTPKISGYP